VRQLTAQNKAALARYDYAPYGELMRSSGLPLTVGYTGHRWDPEIGQYFAPFRYYNPQTTRWNMRDPLGFVDGPNVYAYVAGNPVKNIDPLGMLIAADNLPPGVYSFLPGGVGGALIGGILGGMDQAHCGWGSIAAGASLGAATGFVSGMITGPWALVAGAAAGAFDAVVRGGARGGWRGVAVDAFSGALTGLIGGILPTAIVTEAVTPGESLTEYVVGGVAGLWIQNGNDAAGVLQGVNKPCLMNW